jgi:cytidyltransferase-like protein
VRLLTIGTFDLLHPGHLELLAWCRQHAAPGGVNVGVNRDEFVERYKGRSPVQPFEHRAEVVTALRDVDAVWVNSGDEDARVLIDEVRPDLIVIGDDWLDPEHDERRYFAQLGVTPEWMAERNLRVEYVPRTRGISSTAMRERVA